MFTKEVVINQCYGGFGLSKEACEKLQKLGHPLALKYKENDEYYGGSYLYDIERDDPLLIQVVKELGEKANGCSAKLKIVTICFDYTIEEYDGIEKAGGYAWELG